MKKAALIMNPNAGDGSFKDHLHIIEKKLKNVYHKVDIYKTKEEGEGAEIVRKINEDVDALIGFGGDGTIYELVNALAPLEKRPVFGIIPGGTANDFSRALMMSQDPMEALEQILEGRTEKIDIGSTGDSYFLNFWGIGLVTRVSESSSSNHKASLGKLAYYKNSLKTIKDVESFKVDLTSSEYTYHDEAVMVIAANGPYIGGMQAFFPETNLQDSLLDVLIITEASLKAFLSLLKSRVTKEKVFKKEEIIHFQTKELTISAIPKQLVDTDGEKKEHTPVELRVLPKHLTMFVGPDFASTVR